MSQGAKGYGAAPEDSALLDAVSRETRDDLARIVEALGQWQKAKNLVGPKTLDEVWTRHIADSLQLFHLEPNARRWLDLGSGAGFPGLVIAIMLKSRYGSVSDEMNEAPADTDGEQTHVHCVESNARKCAFIRHAARITHAPVKVHHARIEDVIAGFARSVDVVTARALAPLPKLLAWTSPLLKTGVTGLFPKGDQVAAELTESLKYWRFNYDTLPSQTDPRGRILRITDLRPA
jgi:16S rRNA (guanine527-N7)-methyltransferase